MTAAPGDARADRVAARATGVGIGLLAFMLAWLVAARLTDQLWGPPSSAVVAMAIALVVGIIVAVVAGHQLVRRQLAETRQIAETRQVTEALASQSDGTDRTDRADS